MSSEEEEPLQLFTEAEFLALSEEEQERLLLAEQKQEFLLNLQLWE